MHEDASEKCIPRMSTSFDDDTQTIEVGLDLALRGHAFIVMNLYTALVGLESF